MKNKQGSAQWLAERQNYIGGSDAPIIMRQSPWSTPYELWQRKLGLLDEQTQTFAMSRGVELEPEARQWACDHLGHDFYPQVVYHPEYDYMRASLDGLTLDGKIAIEIKCPGESSHIKAKSGEIPDVYIYQLQHQLACSSIDMLYYVSYFKVGDEIDAVALPVQRDHALIAELIQEEAAFWDLVKTQIPPPLTNRDYVDRECATWASYGARLREIDDVMNLLKAERESIREMLIDSAEGQSSRGGGIVLTRSFVKGRVDYSKIPELQNIDLDQYRSPAKESWTLRLTKSENG